MKTRRHLHFATLPLVLSMLLAGGCSLSGNLAREARDLAAVNEHERALAFALEALDANPGNRTAQIVVDESRQKVLEARKSRGEELASRGDEIAAIREWRNAIILSNEVGRRNFQTRGDGFREAISEAGSIKGKILEDEGHELFFEGRYEEALAKYLQALQLVSSEHLRDQIGQCYYELGQIAISNNHYRKAIEDLMQAARFVPTNSDVQRALLASRYHLGRCYLQKNSLRLAALELEILAQDSPNYRPEGENSSTIRQITDEVIDLATRRISITPFTAADGVNPMVEGRNLPDIMQSAIFSRIDSDKSRFIRLFRADTAAEAFRQIQASRMVEADSRTVREFRFEAADYVLGGTLQNANLSNPPPRSSTQNNSVSLTVYQREVDSQGREVFRPVGQIDHPYSYTLVEDEISLSITVNASLTDVETNASLANPNVTTTEVDRIKYADNLQMRPPPANTRVTLDQAKSRIPSEIRALFDARRNLKSSSQMLDDSQAAVADRIKSWVLDELDETPERSSDPEPCAN